MSRLFQTAPPLLHRLLAGCALLLLVFILCVMTGVLMLWLDDLPEPLPPAPGILAPLQLNLPDPSSVITTDLVARPLFWQARAPVAPPVAREESAQPVARSGQFDSAELLGVFSSAGREGVIVKLPGSRRRVLVGESIDGWSLESVDGAAARWRRSGQGAGERVLHLPNAPTGSQ